MKLIYYGKSTILQLKKRSYTLLFLTLRSFKSKCKYRFKTCFWVFLINLFIYLFLAVLGLRFCARAFSSCGERGPLFIAVRGPLTVAASPVAEHRLQTRRLSSCGSRAQVAPRHVGSSQTRARTRVPCTGRQILNHCGHQGSPKTSFSLVSSLENFISLKYSVGFLFFLRCAIFFLNMCKWIIRKSQHNGYFP